MEVEARLDLFYAEAVKLHRGFREQCWKVLDTELEPELDWHTDMEAEAAGYARRWH